MPQAASASRVCSPGRAGGASRVGAVREKRGAGAGWVTPSRSTKVPRAARCGWCGASARGTTGATQASVPSKTSAHSACVFSRNRALSAARMAAGVGRVVAVGQLDADALDQRRPELRLERADADVLAVGGLVEVVPGRAAVEQASRAASAVEAHRREARRDGVEVRRAVDDRGVDDLSLPAGACLEERGEDPDHEVRRPAAEVAEQVAREVRAVAVLAEAVEGAGDRDVVHVVAGHLRPRSVLAPAGHPAVDQPRVAGQARVGAEPEPLGRAGPQALDQDVGALDEPQHRLDGGRLLEVEGDARAAAVEQVRPPQPEHPAARPVDPDHVGAEVGEQHARVRPRPDARDLHHLHAPQRPGALAQLVRHAPDHDTGAVTVASGVVHRVRLGSPPGNGRPTAPPAATSRWTTPTRGVTHPTLQLVA